FQFVLRGICSRLVYTNRNTGRTDSVSLQSVAKRSKEFLDKRKRKLTAVCSHQTRIGNLDAHLI
ncbi:hypothetical protein FQ028_26085, partial [Escherichia coli]|nr:hypothetical protein [Escherichia coli]